MSVIVDATMETYEWDVLMRAAACEGCLVTIIDDFSTDPADLVCTEVIHWDSWLPDHGATDASTTAALDATTTTVAPDASTTAAPAPVGSSSSSLKDTASDGASSDCAWTPSLPTMTNSKGKKLQTASSRHKSRQPSRYNLSIARRDIESVYDMPLNDAALKLGMRATRLKHVCRVLGIGVWPYRKLRSLERLVAESKRSEQEALDKGDDDGAALHMATTKALASLDEKIRHSPDEPIDAHTKRIRQAYFKATYLRRSAATELFASAAS